MMEEAAPETTLSGTESGESNPTTIAIVGRPNVGKSSLFNRVAGRRKSLVEDLPGTTRDRLFIDVDWHGTPIRLIDTGGLETSPTGTYSSLIRAQIDVALAEADVIIFVVDGRDGLTAEDYDLADLLRKVTRPMLLAANKLDNERRELDSVQFYELGLGDPISISAYHGYGVSDLIDRALDMTGARTVAAPTEASSALAIVGRPNTGKSMLLNALLGEERVIVSAVPGTTRDAIDTAFEFEGRSLTLVDTAGIRRRGHIEPGVERHSVMRSSDAIGRCDVAIVLMDATDPATAQDTHVVQMVVEAYKGLILVVNKIDLLGPGFRQDLTRLLRNRFRFAPWAPIEFISAKDNLGLRELLTTTMEAADARRERVGTGSLNSLLQRAFVEHPPRSVQGRRLKLLYATQPEIEPPTFVLFVNDARLLHFSYRRYIENRLRQTHGFRGTAIQLQFKSRGDTESAPAAQR